MSSAPAPAPAVGAAMAVLAPSGGGSSIPDTKEFSIGKFKDDYKTSKGNVLAKKDNYGYVVKDKTDKVDFKIFGKGGNRINDISKTLIDFNSTLSSQKYLYANKCVKYKVVPAGKTQVYTFIDNTDKLLIFGDILTGNITSAVYKLSDGYDADESTLEIETNTSICSSIKSSKPPGPSGTSSAPVTTPSVPILSTYLKFNSKIAGTTISENKIRQIGTVVQFLYTIEEFKNVVLSYGFQNSGDFNSVLYNIREIFNELETSKNFLSNKLVEIYNFLDASIRDKNSTDIVIYIMEKLFSEPNYSIFANQFKDKISFNQTNEIICNGKPNTFPRSEFILNISLGDTTNGNTTVYREYIEGIPSVPLSDLNFYTNALNFQEFKDASCTIEGGKKVIINAFDFNNEYLLVKFLKLDDENPKVINPSRELIFGIKDKFKLVGGLDSSNLIYKEKKELRILENNSGSDISFSTNVPVSKDKIIIFLYKRIKTEEPPKSSDEPPTFSDYSTKEISCIGADGNSKDCIEFKRNTDILLKILDGDRTFYQHMLSLNISKDFILGKPGGDGKQKASQLTDDLQMSTIIEYYRFCNQNDKIQKSAFLQVVRYFIENPVGKWIDPEKFFELVVLSYIQVKGFSKTKYAKLLTIKDEDFVRLLLFVGRFLPDKNFYIYYKPFGGKIHYINYLYQILRNPASKVCALSDSFFLILLLGFKILGANFSLPVNQNIGAQSYYEGIYEAAMASSKQKIIRSVYDRCMADEDTLFRDTGNENVFKMYCNILTSILKNNESQIIDYYEKIYRNVFDSILSGIISQESALEDIMYSQVSVDFIKQKGHYKLSGLPGYTDGLTLVKGDELLHLAFLSKYLGLLTDNSEYGFKRSFSQKAYYFLLNRDIGRNCLLELPNEEFLTLTPSLAEVIEFNNDECLDFAISLEKFPNYVINFENLDLNTCIENCSAKAFNMLLKKGYMPSYFTMNKIIYLITIYKDYPIIANNNYLEMLIGATNACIRVDKFQEKTLSSMANSQLFKASDKKPEKSDGEAEISTNFGPKIEEDKKSNKTSYALEFLTKFRRYKLKEKICEIKSQTVPRSVKNLLFSISIDITKNIEQICEDLKTLGVVIKAGGGKPQVSSEGFGESGGNKPPQGGGDSKVYFRNITKAYVSQVTGESEPDKKFNSEEYTGSEDRKVDPFLYNPKSIVVYKAASVKKQEQQKSKRPEGGFGAETSEGSQQSQPKGGVKIYIYVPPIFNKILTTKKNTDGSDVPESVLNSIQNTVSNLSKMGISPDKILQADKAYEKFNQTDEITNEDTDYHFLTIIRLLQMYGLDIKLLTQISTNKMITILKNFGIITSTSDEYFFRNLDRAPINLKPKIGEELTIEDELTQQIATFSTYLYYLINQDNRNIQKIIEYFKYINY